MKLRYLAAVAFSAVLFEFGFFRVYYGGSIGFKIVPKYSFGYHDTIVNLDDILRQPRIVVAIQHPEVKRQLEKSCYHMRMDKKKTKHQPSISKGSEPLGGSSGRSKAGLKPERAPTNLPTGISQAQQLMARIAVRILTQKADETDGR